MSTLVKPPVNTPNKAPEKAPEPGPHTRNAARSMFDPRDRPAGHRRLVQEAHAAHAVSQSGDVLRLRRQHPDDHTVDRRARRPGRGAAGFILAIALWLWFTVLFANFAEALAEGRSKAQAASLRSAKHDVDGEEAERAASQVADPHH